MGKYGCDADDEGARDCVTYGTHRFWLSAVFSNSSRSRQLYICNFLCTFDQWSSWPSLFFCKTQNNFAFACFSTPGVLSSLPGDDYSRFTIGKTLFTPVLERLAARHTLVTALGKYRPYVIVCFTCLCATFASNSSPRSCDPKAVLSRSYMSCT